MTANKYTKFQVAVSILVAIRKGINDVQDIVTFTRSKKEIIEQWLEIFKAVKLLVVTPCEKKGRLYPSWTFNYDQEVVYERKAVSLKLDPYKVTAAEFIVLTVSQPRTITELTRVLSISRNSSQTCMAILLENKIVRVGIAPRRKVTGPKERLYTSQLFVEETDLVVASLAPSRKKIPKKESEKKKVIAPSSPFMPRQLWSYHWPADEIPSVQDVFTSSMSE